MDFTGERFVPSLDGQIKYEHLHRYALAMDFAAGKSVLDVASGEGYGAALLAGVAASVTGVDNSPESVEHAARAYYLQNLEFLVGDCESLPLADASVDVVTSFETIEHHDKHEEMMSEIKRVLRPGGVLIISSPNRLTYSDEPNYSNPFHVKELYFDEFHKLLRRHFRHVQIYGQRLAAGSFVYELQDTPAQHLTAYSGGVGHLAARVCNLPSPIYFIAVCSDGPAPDAPSANSVYVDAGDDLWRRSVEAVSISEGQVRRQEEELARARAGYEAHIKRQEEELAQARARYEAQIRRQDEEHSRARAEYEGAIRQQEESVARARDAYESQIAHLTEELTGAREAYESQLVELTATLTRERAEHQARLAEYDARRADDEARLAEVAAARDALAAQAERHAVELSEASARGAAELSKLQEEHAAELAGVRAGYEARAGEYAEALEQARARLAQAQARLTRAEEALSASQSELQAARGQLDRREEMLTWIQTSRAWGAALRLRHLLEQTQGQRRRFGRGLQRLHLTPAPAPVVHGFLDAPAAGAELSGEFEIVGWAFSAAGPVTRVEAFLDDFYLGQLSYGHERRDVVAAYPGRAPEACGYHDRAHVLAYMAGPRTLTVRVYDAEGNTQLFTRAVVASHRDARAQPLPPTSHLQLTADDASGTPASAPGVAAGAAPAATPQAASEAPQDVALARAGGGEVSALKARLEELAAEFRCREEREPFILSWDAGPEMAAAAPHLAVFSPPPGATDGLPYLDETVDIVVLSSDDPVRVAEARRVASAAVARVRVGRPAAAAVGRVPVLEAEWKAEAGKAALPSAAIIIPVHNKVSFTDNCLEQLRATLPANFGGQIIVVDDASTDETPDVLRRWARADRRVEVLRNDENLGFIGACNRGAGAARCEVLVFLNNDTLPRPGWLPPLLRVLSERADAGAVGGKLVYPDGTLQEAGGRIFSDGTGCNFGRNDPEPDAPLYSFLREVDYCSGALLATPRALFLRLGGFDTRFAPAYYEDTDYCFALREREGLRVYYQPESVVVHFEGVTSGTDVGGGVKRYQEVNRAKFVDKWRRALERQPAPPDRYDFDTLHALSVRDGAGGEDEDA